MYTDINKIMEQISDMESIVDPTTGENYTPIVLRHRDSLDTDGNNLFGLWGFSARSTRGVGGGNIKLTGGIDNNKVCTFYHDKKNVQWAVIPDCKHNRDALILCAPTLPVIIQEGPKDFIDAFKKAKADYKEMIQKRNTIQGTGELHGASDTKDPFNYTLPDTVQGREDVKITQKKKKAKEDE